MGLHERPLRVEPGICSAATHKAQGAFGAKATASAEFADGPGVPPIPLAIVQFAKHKYATHSIILKYLMKTRQITSFITLDEAKMDWLWNWGGECFGYRDRDDLFAYHGKQVGQFHGDEIYGADGRYLGELMNQNRLITHRGKKGWRQSSFAPSRRGGYARYAGYAGYAMYAGYEDFPAPDQFR